MIRRLSLLVFPVFMAALFLPAAPARAQARCVAGARVAAASYGHWYAATVIRPEGGNCRVHFDRYSASSDEAVTPDNLGPIALANQYDNAGAAGTGGSAQASTGGRALHLVPASYHCSSFVGPVTGGGHMIPMPGITILANGTYRHASGGGGRVSGANGTLVFVGGPLNGRAATYDAGPSGRGTLHLYNDNRSRTVIDCDG